MNNFNSGELVNVGSGENISIKALANIVASVVNYTGDIEWDTSRPNGTPNRPLDSSKIKSLGWTPKYSLYEGLKKTYRWFIEHTYYDSCK